MHQTYLSFFFFLDKNVKVKAFAMTSARVYLFLHLFFKPVCPEQNSLTEVYIQAKASNR